MINNSAQSAAQSRNAEPPSAQAEAQIWTTHVDQEEQPTSDAQVSIEVAKEKFEAGMRVPQHSRYT
jgi:hypothetical protein